MSKITITTNTTAKIEWGDGRAGSTDRIAMLEAIVASMSCPEILGMGIQEHLRPRRPQ